MAERPRGMTLRNAREQDIVLRDFRFESGDVLPELRLHCLTFGTPVRDAAGSITNAVLLLHPTLGSGRSWFLPTLAGELFGDGQPLDAGRFFLVLPDAIGHGGSSKPSDGLRARFPRYRYRAIVRATHRLVTEELGIARLRLLVGTSMGAMQAWMWGFLHPGSADGLVAVACMPERIRGRNWAIRRLMIESIRQDPAWLGGDYDANPSVHAVTAPLLFLLATGAGEYARDWSTIADADASFAKLVDFARDIDANDCLYALEAIMDYDPAPGLDGIVDPFLSINFADDDLVSPRPDAVQAALARMRKGSGVVIAPRRGGLGHFTYNEASSWAGHLATFVDGLPARP